MKAYGGVDVEKHIFLTSSLAGGEWSQLCPWRFTPAEKAPGTHCVGGKNENIKDLYRHLKSLIKIAKPEAFLIKYENSNVPVSSEGFWRWYVTLRIAEFLDFVHLLMF
jgi:hypothetical protein